MEKINGKEPFIALRDKLIDDLQKVKTKEDMGKWMFAIKMSFKTMDLIEIFGIDKKKFLEDLGKFNKDVRGYKFENGI